MSTPNAVKPRKRRSLLHKFLIGFAILLMVTIFCIYLSGRGGGATLMRAYARADAEDPNWRWQDKIKHLPVVPKAEDAGQMIFPTMDEKPGTISYIGAFRFNMDYLKTMMMETLDYRQGFYEMEEIKRFPLKFDMERMAPEFLKLEQVTKYNRIHFNYGPITNQSFISSPVPAIATFIGVAELFRQRAVWRAIQKDPLALEGLLTHLHYHDLSFQAILPCNVELNDNLIAAEFMLGQTVFPEEQLKKYQDRLSAFLDDTRSVQAGLRFTRQAAYIMAEMYHQDDPMVKSQFGKFRFFMGPLIHHGAAETITLTTELIEKAKLSMEEMHQHFEAKAKSYSYDSGDLREIIMQYPRNFFFLYFLPKIKFYCYRLVYESQAKLRATLLGLAAERYQLKMGKFPEKQEELASYFTPEIWQRISKTEKGMKFAFFPTANGLIILQVDAAGNYQNWTDETMLYGKLANTPNIRLYHPQRRAMSRGEEPLKVMDP